MTHYARALLSVAALSRIKLLLLLLLPRVMLLQSLFDAINAHNNASILFVAAAGNAGSNTDVSISYPAGYSECSRCELVITCYSKIHLHF